MKNCKDKCILFFMKYPEKGKVKQRLAPWLKDEVIVELYRHFVQDVFQTIKTLDTPSYIFVSPEEKIEECRTLLGSDYSYIAQKGENLGERMKNGFHFAFSEGYHRVVLLGSDSPDLPGLYISAAFRSLEEYAGVIGPCTDGGYYLIGFSETVFRPEVFNGISWSTPQVFVETVQQCKKAGISLAVLPEWSDIDIIDDLKEFMFRNQDVNGFSSHTLSFLNRTPQITNIMKTKDEDTSIVNGKD